MDAITSIALSIDSPILHEIGMLIQNPFVYAVLILGVLWLGERRLKKQKKIVFSLILTLLLVLGIKNLMAIERPCIDSDWLHFSTKRAMWHIWFLHCL